MITKRRAEMNIVGKLPSANSAERMFTLGDVKADAFVSLGRTDAKLAIPKLIVPSLQINMRAGNMPPPDEHGDVFLNFINKLKFKKWRENTARSRRAKYANGLDLWIGRRCFDWLRWRCSFIREWPRYGRKRIDFWHVQNNRSANLD